MPTPPTQHAPLVAGVPLEQAQSSSELLRLFAISFVVLWVSGSLVWGLWSRSPWAFLDAFAWSALASLLLTVGSIVYRALAPSALRLTLRNQKLQIERRKEPLWSLPLEQPFIALLFTRAHKEDALLLLRRQLEPPCLLYGRYRRELPLPPHVVEVGHLPYSMAEEALDRYGAYMMQDRKTEHLPRITQLLSGAEGYGLSSLELPFTESDWSLTLAREELLVSSEQRKQRHALAYPWLALNGYQVRVAKGHVALMLRVMCDPMATIPEPDQPGGPPPQSFPTTWLLVDWPQEPTLSQLPELALPSDASPQIYLTPLECAAFLAHLMHKGIGQTLFTAEDKESDWLSQQPTQEDNRLSPFLPRRPRR